MESNDHQPPKFSLAGLGHGPDIIWPRPDGPGRGLPHFPKLPKHLNFVEEVEGIKEFAQGFESGGGRRRPLTLELALWTWGAAIIDLLMMIGLTCFYAVIFFAIMKVSAASFLKVIVHNQGLLRILITFFFISFFTYLVFLRGFLGATLGEWSCSLRLGEPIQRQKPLIYLARVAVRSLVVMMTGIIIVPICSLILKRDLAGEMSGLYTYRTK